MNVATTDIAATDIANADIANTNIPGPAGKLGLGLYVRILTSDFLQVSKGLFKRYGDMAFMTMGFNNHILVLRHPHHVEQVLKDKRFTRVDPKNSLELISPRALNITDFTTQPHWDSKYALFNDYLKQQTNREMSAVDTHLASMTVRWDQAIASKANVDASRDILHLTTSILCELAFDQPPPADVQQIDDTKYYLTRVAVFLQLLPPLLRVPSRIMRFFPGVGKQIKRREQFAKTIVSHHIKRDSKPQNYLAALVAREKITSAKSEETKKIDGEIMTALFVGSDPLDKAIVNTLFFLAKYPEWQQIAREDKSNKQLVNCLFEALRLLPPYPVMARVANQPVTLGNYTIPAGTTCVTVPEQTHLHPHFWQEPSTFNPDRFSNNKNQPGFIAFSLGNHKCPGKSRVIRIAPYVLRRLVDNYQFALVSRDYSPVFKGSLSFKDNVHFKLTKIKQSTKCAA